MRAVADAIAWLWRLGAVRERPAADAVGLGWQEDAVHLQHELDAGRLAGTAVFASRPGPEVGPVPGRQLLRGVADFGAGRRIVGSFTVLHGGTACLSSSLGVHAVRDGAQLVVGGDLDASWGTIAGSWMLDPLAELLVSTLDRPLVQIPPIGWVRYDDVPGNAYQQLAGRDHPDPYWKKRIGRVVEAFSTAGAKINLAITARALEDGALVGLERVWPEAMKALAEGVGAAVIEPVCHGLSHVEPAALARMEADPREFRSVDEERAGEMLDESLGWLERVLGERPGTFVAPTWSYGPGVRAALASRGLAAWLPATPAPLVDGMFANETLVSTLDGLWGLDYEPLRDLADAGLPPTLVVHGGLFDPRVSTLRSPRHAPTLARLAQRRDLFRVPWVEGVEWIGATDLHRRLRAHGEITVTGAEVSLPPGASAIVRDRHGRRLQRAY